MTFENILFNNNTFKLIDFLKKDTCNIEFKLVFHIDTKTCDFEFNELLARCTEWFESQYQVFIISNLEFWFIAKLIIELILNIDINVLKNLFLTNFIIR